MSINLMVGQLISDRIEDDTVVNFTALTSNTKIKDNSLAEGVFDDLRLRYFPYQFFAQILNILWLQ